MNIDVNNYIVCPVCQLNMVHLATTEIRLGSVRLLAREDVASVRELDEAEPSMRRGSEILIGMICESGHEWQLRLRFHKGSTTVYCEPPENELVDLWRD